MKAQIRRVSGIALIALTLLGNAVALIQAQSPITYTVQSGDVPGAIAAQYNTSVSALMAVNGISDPRLLQIGQVLTIPAPGETGGEITLTHTIIGGDTLLGLAFEYSTSLDAILAANPGINPALLQIGQIVNVPVSAEALTAPKEESSVGPVQPYAAPVDVPITLSDTEAATFIAINAQRAAQGLSPYRADEQLAAVARNHAADMATRSYFGHVTPEGAGLRDRLTAAGLSPVWAGENYQLNGQPADKTVSTAVTWWMNSTPHRANILHTRYTRIGVGAAGLADGGTVFVLVFAGD